jgi:DNA polymerase-1
VLASLKAKGKARELIDSLLKRGSLEKLRGTYLHGLPKLIQTMDWVEDTLHGTLNQCVAITGRLSSTKPNLQNIDGNIGYLFKSRYV